MPPPPPVLPPELLVPPELIEELEREGAYVGCDERVGCCCIARDCCCEERVCCCCEERVCCCLVVVIPEFELPLRSVEIPIFVVLVLLPV